MVREDPGPSSGQSGHRGAAGGRPRAPALRPARLSLLCLSSPGRRAFEGAEGADGVRAARAWDEKEAVDPALTRAGPEDPRVTAALHEQWRGRTGKYVRASGGRSFHPPSRRSRQFPRNLSLGAWADGGSGGRRPAGSGRGASLDRSKDNLRTVHN